LQGREYPEQQVVVRAGTVELIHDCQESLYLVLLDW
jgi:hypothetical protein